MKQHELKSWVGLFEPINVGAKTHDLRVMDRNIMKLETIASLESTMQ